MNCATCATVKVFPGTPRTRNCPSNNSMSSATASSMTAATVTHLSARRTPQHVSGKRNRHRSRDWSRARLHTQAVHRDHLDVFQRNAEIVRQDLAHEAVLALPSGRKAKLRDNFPEAVDAQQNPFGR